LPRTRIKTLEELLAYCKVDTAVWEVERYVVNTWEVGMRPPAITKYVQTKDGRRVPAWTRETGAPIVEELYQVKAWLRKRIAVVQAMTEVESLRRKAEAFAPNYPTTRSRKTEDSGNLLELSIMDQHFGRLAWGRETGWGDWDTKLAQKAQEDAVAALIHRTKGYNIDEVLLPIGNDLQNTDNREGMTTKGTPQSTDSRYQKVFEITRDAMIWSVEAALTVGRTVRVITVPGNHDFLTTWHLGDTLAAWFHKCPNVLIDNAPKFRKYHEHGDVMLMFTHGNSGKLEEYPLLMATEQREMWGRTLWHEAHTGDKHQRRLIELKGAVVRILPSLSPPDAWLSEKCFVGNIRCAEAYVWNRTEGLLGTAVFSLPQATDR
jgi:hypothetical protein